MTERLKGNIQMPVWLFGLLVTIVMAIFGWGVATASNGSKMQTQIEVNSQTLQELKLVDIRLQAEKADKATIEDIKATLVRIENKLDIHLAK